MPDRRSRFFGLFGLVLLATGLAVMTVRAIVSKVGHPGAPLDDAYIHFQYARAIAEGHPFRFQAGAPATSGATSLLWPFLLAPFYALGARDELILFPAWGVSFLALALLAYEAFLLTRRLAGDAAGGGAALLVLSFSGFLWGAATGMEALPFAWATAHAVRRAADWAEDPVHQRTLRRAMLVAVAASFAPLLRPEGALVAGFVAVTLLVFAGERRATRLFAPVALAGALLVPAILFLTTGSFRSSTAVVKLLAGNPYYAGDRLLSTVRDNLEFLRTSILDGGPYSVEFVPRGGAPFAFAGLFAVAVCGVVRQARWRALGVLLLALSIVTPCAYGTFLWNRLRYLWPFATGWLIGIACLARCASDFLSRFVPRFRFATGLLCGLAAGVLVAKQDGVIADIADSASGIDRQQVRLGRWAKSELPANALIGVNDTGAIAYFSDRKTFDVVGLATDTEAKYWVAGAGSRFEHYERLHAERPNALPSVFIVYPQWMAMPAVLGRTLFEATVTDSTILGGTTMEVHDADWSLLDSGALPWSRVSGKLADELDVADLESEAAHQYGLRGASDSEDVAAVGLSPLGPRVADGGRKERSAETFTLHLGGRPHPHVVAIARVESPTPIRLEMHAAGSDPVTVPVKSDGWTEVRFDLGELRGDETVDVRSDSASFASFHYWFFDE